MYVLYVDIFLVNSFLKKVLTMVLVSVSTVSGIDFSNGETVSIAKKSTSAQKYISPGETAPCSYRPSSIKKKLGPTSRKRFSQIIFSFLSTHSSARVSLPVLMWRKSGTVTTVRSASCLLWRNEGIPHTWAWASAPFVVHVCKEIPIFPFARYKCVQPAWFRISAYSNVEDSQGVTHQ